MCDGGLSGPFATMGNTTGIGDPVPARMDSLGSGDLFGQVLRPASKKGAPGVQRKNVKNKQTNSYGEMLPTLVMLKK